MVSRASRADRFRTIRDAIMAEVGRMKLIAPSIRELNCGSFHIVYAYRGAYGHGRGHNIQIWPERRLDAGHMMSDHKVANVDWNDRDDVSIIQRPKWRLGE